MKLKTKIILKKKLLSFLYKENEVVKPVKDDFNKNKSVYFELNKHISNDATIFHIADDFGQKDILLTLQQAGRRVFSLINDEEKRRVAQNNYLVQRRKIFYIDNQNQINKKVDLLLISDDNFNLNDIKDLPETIILLNSKNQTFENPNYKEVVISESIKIFRHE